MEVASDFEGEARLLISSGEGLIESLPFCPFTCTLSQPKTTVVAEMITELTRFEPEICIYNGN